MTPILHPKLAAAQSADHVATRLLETVADIGYLAGRLESGGKVNPALALRPKGHP